MLVLPDPCHHLVSAIQKQRGHDQEQQEQELVGEDGPVQPPVHSEEEGDEEPGVYDDEGDPCSQDAS